MAKRMKCGFGMISLFLPVMVLFIEIFSLEAATDTSTAQPVTSHDTTESTHTDNSTDGHASGGVQVASWRWEYVQIPLTITIYALLIGLAKIGG